MREDPTARGLYQKFRVERTDGRSAPGEKHDGCDYFVLDLTHDQFARPALLAYAAACEHEYPALASDLRTKCAASRASRATTLGALQRERDDPIPRAYAGRDDVAEAHDEVIAEDALRTRKVAEALARALAVERARTSDKRHAFECGVYSGGRCDCY